MHSNDNLEVAEYLKNMGFKIEEKRILSYQMFNESIEKLPSNIIDDLKNTGYDVISIHPHGKLHIMKLKKHIDVNFDPKDFSRFSWVVDNNHVNFNNKEFSIKVKF